MSRTTLSAAAALAIGLASGSALAQDKCGLGNGKKASGEPIELGAVVGKTGPEDFSSSGRAASCHGTAR